MYMSEKEYQFHEWLILVKHMKEDEYKFWNDNNEPTNPAPYPSMVVVFR